MGIYEQKTVILVVDEGSTAPVIKVPLNVISQL